MPRRTQLPPKGQRVLVILFIPSVQRDGKTAIDQEFWVTGALELLGRTFGGATAFGRARGVWRDDERRKHLVWDHPVPVHCYTKPEDIEDHRKLEKLLAFCRELGSRAHQGEVGLIIDNWYVGIRDFEGRAK